MKIVLTPEEKQDLELRHEKECDGRVRDRIKSILLRDEGWTISKIAQALRLHNDTISRYVIDYIDGKKLHSAHQGSQGKLSGDQIVELKRHLNERMYDKACDIAAHVQEVYGVHYTTAGMTNWLQRNNFSYKQPKEQPAKADPEKQKVFVEEYRNLKEKTPENEPILFMDSVHPTMASKVSRGWIQRGLAKILPTTASRTRLNIAGTIELSTMKTVIDDYETINGASIISFLERVKAAYAEAPQIHIILDQSGYHRSLAVSQYAEKNGIKLHFLPPYSPNLNPIERLWKVMNEQVRNNYFFKTAQEFRERIRGFFKDTLPEMRDSLHSRINDNFHMIEAAK